MAQADIPQPAQNGPARGAPDPKTRPRRGYKSVGLCEENGSYLILLDGKPARTPLKRSLSTPFKPLAEAVAREWAAQEAAVAPDTMPMTRLLATAIDRVGSEREAVIAALLAYAGGDVVCYRAASPNDLRQRQLEVWEPVVRWLADAHGIALQVIDGVMPAPQPLVVIARLEVAMAALDCERLTAFQACAAVTGSLALAMALVHGRLDAGEVFAAAVLDETYQMERWGEDPQAAARRQRIAADIAAAAEFLRLIAAKV